MSNRSRVQKTFEFFTGATALLSANIITFLFFKLVILKILDYPSAEWRGYWLLLGISYTIVFFCFYSSINLAKRSRSMEFASTLRNCSLTYMLFAVLLIITKNKIIESRYLFLGAFAIFTVLALITRYFLKRMLMSKFSDSKMASIVGVITDSARAEEFISALKVDWSKNVKAVALLDTVYEDGTFKKIKHIKKQNSSSVSEKVKLKAVSDICGVPVVANAENLMGWVRTASLDEVFINLDSNFIDSSKGIAHLIEELEDMGIVVNVNIPSLEHIIENSKFDNLNCIVTAGYPMAVFSPVTHSALYLGIKKAFDFIGGVLGSIVSLPIILLTAIPLLIESPGPLIFKQQRIGRNGRVFNIYKLRSMYADAEERKKELMQQNKMDGHMFKMDNDPRITKVGRFIRKYSIDELPQFWNVVKGDMSLVGTRPPTIDEFEKYESHHKRRLSMNPGITGMWQVSGRSDIEDFEEVVELDCEYIDNWSLWLDIKILFKTVVVVLTHKGAE